jgi:hypothetical protein
MYTFLITKAASKPWKSSLAASYFTSSDRNEAMATVPETTTTRKTPIAYFGWLYESHGVFLQAAGVVSFRDSDTHTWQDVDLETLTRWASLNGRVDLAEAQALADDVRGGAARICTSRAMGVN